MRRSKKKESVYKSMDEFEEKFFPNFFKKRLEESMDVHTLAVSLAEQSLEKIKRQLVK